MTTTSAIISQIDLEGVELFRGISGDLYMQVMQAAPGMLHFYSSGDVILNKGEHAERLVLLLHGHTSVYVGDVFLVIRENHAVLGEQAFINGTEHSATVRALGAVTTLELPRYLVERLMEDAAFTKRVWREVGDRGVR
jgi:CRP-like cAMP-binding protein